MSIFLLLLACGGEPASVQPAPAPQSADHPPIGPPPAMAMLSAAEDLSSSWKPELQGPVEAAGTTRSCPKGMNLVPAGAFLMGSASAHAGKDEQPVHRVKTDSYCMDRTEVSAADVAAWFAKTKKKPAGADPKNPGPDGAVLPGKSQHPAEGLSWQEASDYCQARGARLPREAEWEKAARGGCELGQDPSQCDPEDLRPYPWGKATPTCALANHQQVGPQGPRLCQDGSMPVDSLPDGAGPYGHLHLAGNVWEYVADSWHPKVYRPGRMDNPAGPPTLPGAPRGLRGGGWNTFSTNMRVANRFHDLIMGSSTGFRCVVGDTKTVGIDLIEPLQMVQLSGTVSRQDGAPITGRALYITAFDASETDPETGMPAPGRSPSAEVHIGLEGSTAQHFVLPVPMGGIYRISAALDDGSGGADMPAAGSGGIGLLAQPVVASGHRTGLSVVLGPPPGRRHHP